MREIKFRAWDKKHNDMLEDVGIEVDKYSNLTISSRGIFIRPDNPDFELMQYTGLRDKNGTEIHEGDIISIMPNNPKGYVAEVYWQGGGFETTSVDGDSSTALHATLYEAVDRGNCKIIGNIYENKELMNE